MAEEGKSFGDWKIIINCLKTFSEYPEKKHSQSTRQNGIYAHLLIKEFYVSLNCEQRHLGIAHFLLQPPQYGILCLRNLDILILSIK